VTDDTETIVRLNAMPAAEAQAVFHRCCGATCWAAGMTFARPFADRAAVSATAEALWPELESDDWREAFSHHPKIGDIEGLRRRFATTRAWSSGEQSGVDAADEETLQALAAGNAAYEAKFGYIFIVCATGKTAAEMLALLQQRLPNDPVTELPIAAAEQQKITRLRLDKLFAEGFA